jgi:AAA family ATP:ADP antiporter
MADQNRDSSTGRKGLLDQVLKLFSEVRPGEAATLILLTADVFLLLLGYYVLKTVREPLILASAAADAAALQSSSLPEWLQSVLQSAKGPQLKASAAAMQVLLLAGFIPLYSWFASKISRLWLLVGVTSFFVGCMVLFFVASEAGIPFVGFVFYAWVGIFSVAMIAQFWSFANDIYTRKAGERLFPIIAIGATAGAPVGSKLAGMLSDAEWSAFQLVLMTAAIIVVYLVVSLAVHFREPHRGDAGEELADKGVERKLEKGGGFALVLRNKYLLLLGFMMLLLNLVNTSGEYILSDFVVAAAQAATPEGGDIGPYIGAFYGDFYFYVNIIALILQAFVVSRIIKYVGVKGIVFALPMVALGTYGLIGVGVGIGIVTWAKTAENSTDYSIMNTAKALLWLPTTQVEKYKAKQTVDTVFVRLGDLCAALLFIVGTTLLGFGIGELAFINLGFIVLWIFVAFAVLKRYQALADAQKTAEG